jgi:hypothetical protein
MMKKSIGVRSELRGIVVVVDGFELSESKVVSDLVSGTVTRVKCKKTGQRRKVEAEVEVYSQVVSTWIHIPCILSVCSID